MAASDKDRYDIDEVDGLRRNVVGARNKGARVNI